MRFARHVLRWLIRSSPLWVLWGIYFTVNVGPLGFLIALGTWVAATGLVVTLVRGYRLTTRARRAQQ
jgi:hypothetical protein